MTDTNFALSLPSPPPRQPRWLRRLISGGAVGVAASAGLWIAAHELPGFGPWAADALRAAIGVDGVAQLEDTVYGVRDAVNQVTHAGQATKTYWEVPEARLEQTPSFPRATDVVEEAPWAPPSVTLPFSEVAAEGDGVWVPVGEGTDNAEMSKTLVHPDPKRTWAELFVVAINLEEAELHWVPGSAEPQSIAPGAHELTRAATIPKDAQGALLAAFNGGFKTQHGRFGAKSDGITLVPPRPHQCTVGATESGQLVLGTYKDLKNKSSLQWMRQTPGCMVEDGTLHPQLVDDTSTNWGATLDGGTVIRRSALGLSKDETTLYVGISNDTTARALALGMQAAGAHTVAQLDVNYAYPKFVLFDQEGDELKPRSLVEGFVMHEGQYLRREGRDFFYVSAF